jgi:hypothetical protein
MNRRTTLKTLVTLGVPGVTGCSTVGSWPRTEPDVQNRTSEATRSGDPSPVRSTADTATTDGTPRQETIADVAEGEEVSGVVGNVDSGEVLVFPPGRFRWTDLAVVTHDDWGVRCHPDTVFEVPAGWGDGDMGLVLKTVSSSGVADNVLLENLTFDSSGRAAPHVRLGVRSAAHVDGLHYRMNGPLTNQQHGNGITAFVERSSGTLRIDDYRQFNNGDLGAYGGGDSRIGIYVGSRNEGTVHLRNPVLQGFPNNACYVSRQPGTVIVDGGLLMNNNVSAVRVSGNVAVRDTTVVVDVDRYLEGAGVIQASAHNARGLWGDSRDIAPRGGHISGVSFVLNSYRRSTGLIEVRRNPHMTVRDSQFLLGASIVAVRADTGPITVAECDFVGGSTASTAGVGTITGAGNHVGPDIDPGAVPVERRSAEFDWSMTHRETPARWPGDGPASSPG